MTTLVNDRPDVRVQTAEYTRLLGFPPGWELRDRSWELAEWAREWYAQHGRPWASACEARSLDVRGGTIHIDGVAFTSTRLAKTMRDAGAHGVALVAVSAGPELEAEAQRLWQDGRPDEYFFLEVYGSAVVEHLITMTGARLCASAEGRHMAVLPHYSPGYPEWSIEEQGTLMGVMRRALIDAGPAGAPSASGPLEVLGSGMLRPKKSLLAVFGITRHVDRVARLTDLVPCENCSFAGCQYRRVSYKRARARAVPELPAVGEAWAAERTSTAPPKYTVNEKALQRWAEERLSLKCRDDGRIEATFRYDGTTCTNMGRPLAFRYDVTLGSREQGYPIVHQRCAPVSGDDGYTYMCRYLSHGDPLMAAIEGEAPLAGQRLGDALAWPRPDSAAGCYCDADARLHKWGLVLETIHYALERLQASGTGQAASARRNRNA